MHSNKNRKIFLIIIAIIIIIGFILGLCYFLLIDNNIKQNVINTISNLNSLRINDILKDLLIMSFLLISSFFIVGIPLSLFYFFYESFSLGFITMSFFKVYKLKSIIYLIIYLLFTKIPILILMIIFFKKLINITRLLIGMFIYKREITIKEKIIKNFINALYIILFVLIIDILKYLISPLFFSLLR